VKLFLAFSFVWLGILNCRNNSFLARYALMIPLVILATVILSSRITRIVGIVYPIVIPALPSVSGTTGKRAAEGGKAPCS